MESVESENIINKEFGVFGGRGEFVQRDKMA